MDDLALAFAILALFFTAAMIYVDREFTRQEMRITELSAEVEALTEVITTSRRNL